MCACGVGYTAVNWMGEDNFSTHCPEVRNRSICSNKKIEYGTLQKYDYVSVPTYGLSGCMY